MTQADAPVLLDHRGGIRILTLNRPEKRNAANFALQQRLLVLLNEIADDPEARVLVLTGAGSTFCAGGDRLDLMAASEGRLANEAEFATVHRDTIRGMLGLAIPTIAAVNGPAAGLGAGLVALCDLVVIGEGGALWDPHTQYGLPGSPTLQLIWPWLTSQAMAKELLMTGRKVGAEEAVRLGLANRMCPTGQELATALEIAEGLCGMPPEGLAATKRAFNRPLLEDFAAGRA